MEEGKTICKITEAHPNCSTSAYESTSASQSTLEAPQGKSCFEQQTIADSIYGMRHKFIQSQRKAAMAKSAVDL